MSAAQDLQAFLAAHGWGDATHAPLSGDASTRRFARLTRTAEPNQAVLISATPGASDTAAFVRIAGLLRAVGLSAPDIYAVDLQHGLILAEDFGDTCLGRLPEAERDPGPFCAAAVEVLMALHQRFEVSTAVVAALPDFSPALFLEQVSLFLDSYLPVVRRAPASEASRADFRAAWAAVLPLAYRVPRSLLLRDFHLGNIMRLGGREGLPACGLLDFQDAGLGPVTYDLVSLLEDARLPTDGCAPALFARYRAAFPALDASDFVVSCAVLGALRHCRILAIFARLAAQQGKRDYLRFLPRVWQLFERRLAEPALVPVAAWFTENVPMGARIPAAFRALDR